jgi:DNA-binding transcriptional MocR family regulator
MLAALSRSGIVGQVLGHAAGLHMMVNLHAGADEAWVVGEARRSGIRVDGGTTYGAAPGEPALVLGYGALDERDIDAGVAALAAVVVRSMHADACARQLVTIHPDKTRSRDCAPCESAATSGRRRAA